LEYLEGLSQYLEDEKITAEYKAQLQSKFQERATTELVRIKSITENRYLIELIETCLIQLKEKGAIDSTIWEGLHLM
jgi:hypothetical protein